MIKAVVFDLDGTMINSEKAAYETWFNAGRRVGKTFTEDDLIMYTHGVRLKEAVRNMLTLWQLEDEKDAIMEILGEEWVNAKKGIELMPGVYEIHARITELGLPWATATASDRPYTTEMLTRFNLIDTCAAIACGDEVVHTKPAPDIFLLAAERLNLDPKQCLAIEDSVPGHEAAAAAGMRVIAVPDPRFNTADEYPRADYVFSSLDEVRENLDQLFSEQGVVV